jgi:hypothetical protein
MSPLHVRLTAGQHLPWLDLWAHLIRMYSTSTVHFVGHMRGLFEERGAQCSSTLILFVKSQRAAERVMRSTTRYVDTTLKLKVNPAKARSRR